MGILREVQGARPENGRCAPVVREFIVYRSAHGHGRRVRRLGSCLFRRRQ